jgi:hypothetical protein
MKLLMGIGSAWVFFWMADEAIYGGDHVRTVIGCLTAILAAVR